MAASAGHEQVHVPEHRHRRRLAGRDGPLDHHHPAVAGHRLAAIAEQPQAGGFVQIADDPRQQVDIAVGRHLLQHVAAHQADALPCQQAGEVVAGHAEGTLAVEHHAPGAGLGLQDGLGQFAGTATDVDEATPAEIQEPGDLVEGQVARLHRQQEAPAGIRAALQVAIEVFAERQLEAWGTAEQRLAGGRPGGVELLAVEQHHVAEGALDIPQQVAGGGIGVAVAGIALEDLEGHQQAHQSMDALGIGTDRGGQRLVAVDPALDQIGQPEARSDVDATGLPFPGNNLYQITRSSKIRIIHLLFSLVTHFRNPRSTQALYFALLARSARNTAEHPGSFGTLRKNALIPRISAPWISLRKQPWNFPTACSRAFSCVPKE
ncbi:hypothetical protein PAERUG_P54_1_London_24_VIM_2_04_13_05742 [Pseudomonas aeruginosa]|nr:hypothetical protein PAERUG_P54_1_London_24_VIM_2_04_13_05742 [Pseudomonas aeruginosa]